MDTIYQQWVCFVRPSHLGNVWISFFGLGYGWIWDDSGWMLADGRYFPCFLLTGFTGFDGGFSTGLGS